jgi:hypothetical protein
MQDATTAGSRSKGHTTSGDDGMTVSSLIEIITSTGPVKFTGDHVLHPAFYISKGVHTGLFSVTYF